MSPDATAMRYVVVGAGGSIGGMLVRLLRADGKQVHCIDLCDPPRHGDADWIVTDILDPSPAARAVLAAADTLICAISLERLSLALPGLLPRIPPQCALIETLSIKAPFAALLEQHSAALAGREIAGINPMFSGDLDPAGRAAATVCYDTPGTVVPPGERHAPHATALFDVLGRAGMITVPVDPQTHDRSMAALQTIVHGAVLAFGGVLCDAELDMHALLALAPPPFRVMFALMARLTCNHPDVYWEIQKENPYSRAARRALADNLTKLDRECAENDAAAFRERLTRIGTELVAAGPDAVARSKQIFDLFNRPV